MLNMAGLTPEQAKADVLARFADLGPDHINCAQAIVRYALLVTGGDLRLTTAARYLGGGVAGMGESCGVITGTALALGLRDHQMASDDPDLKPMTAESLRELICDFIEEFGACRCFDLTGLDLSTPERHDVFRSSEARERCVDYASWMCDQLTPLLQETAAD